MSVLCTKVPEFWHKSPVNRTVLVVWSPSLHTREVAGSSPAVPITSSAVENHKTTEQEAACYAGVGALVRLIPRAHCWEATSWWEDTNRGGHQGHNWRDASAPGA